MDARFLLLLLCLCTSFFPSPGLVLQRDTNGISVHTRRRLLSHGNRQVLAIKAPDDKEQNAHTHDISANATDKGAKSGSNETEPISVPSPPHTKSEDMQPPLEKEAGYNNSSPNVENPDGQMKDDTAPPEKKPDGQKKDDTAPPEKKPDGQKKDDTAPPEKKPSTPPIQCGESHCEDPKRVVSACLWIPGDGVHKLSMFITSEADSEVVVNVVAPQYLKANPPEVSVLKGKSETIQFLMDSKVEVSMLDLEAVKNKSISVKSSYGECEIAVPLEYLRGSAPERKPPFSSYLPSVTPRALAYLVALILVVAVVGTWLCYKCCKKKRGGDVKYQQLEMIAPGQSTPKEREEQGTAAWDEDWDDDWEDAEAAKSSSRLSQNLSSRGLGARKNNKDGWDNSWED